jgi:hypothetical protein
MTTTVTTVRCRHLKESRRDAGSSSVKLRKMVVTDAATVKAREADP